MSLVFFLRNVPGVVLLSFLLVFAAVPAWSESAPEFALKDSAGNTVSLEDFKGKPLVLHFWVSWCPYCKKVQPGLERLVGDNTQHDLKLLGISFREDEGVVPQDVLTQRGHTFKTLVFGDDIARAYGVKGTPTTFFISRNGELVSVTNTSDPNSPELARMAAAIVR